MGPRAAGAGLCGKVRCIAVMQRGTPLLSVTASRANLVTPIRQAPPRRPGARVRPPRLRCSFELRDMRPVTRHVARRCRRRGTCCMATILRVKAVNQVVTWARVCRKMCLSRCSWLQRRRRHAAVTGSSRRHRLDTNIAVATAKLGGALAERCQLIPEVCG